MSEQEIEPALATHPNERDTNDIELAPTSSSEAEIEQPRTSTAPRDRPLDSIPEDEAGITDILGGLIFLMDDEDPFFDPPRGFGSLPEIVWQPLPRPRTNNFSSIRDPIIMTTKITTTTTTTTTITSTEGVEPLVTRTTRTNTTIDNDVSDRVGTEATRRRPDLLQMELVADEALRRMRRQLENSRNL